MLRYQQNNTFQRLFLHHGKIYSFSLCIDTVPVPQKQEWRGTLQNIFGMRCLFLCLSVPFRQYSAGVCKASPLVCLPHFTLMRSHKLCGRPHLPEPEKGEGCRIHPQDQDPDIGTYRTDRRTHNRDVCSIITKQSFYDNLLDARTPHAPNGYNTKVKGGEIS